MKRMNYWHYWIIVLPGNELFITLTIHYIFQQTKSCTLFLHFITKLNDMHSLVRLLFILLNLALSWGGANLFFFTTQQKNYYHCYFHQSQRELSEELHSVTFHYVLMIVRGF